MNQGSNRWIPLFGCEGFQRRERLRVNDVACPGLEIEALLPDAKGFNIEASAGVHAEVARVMMP